MDPVRENPDLRVLQARFDADADHFLHVRRKRTLELQPLTSNRMKKRNVMGMQGMTLMRIISENGCAERIGRTG